ncbi:6-phosphofructokinase [Taibaiella sp. KBW10]|uniref:6-phosphofructokinase n=1 Tax=Taibaiella sp. KBW10 TaxID=2153357 RepID=UPI000F5A7AC5|nr:6-phosphofructokinase [Taibaiella sp. KBW10]RQO30843.1 6-phosphofructokinase [Taibaiella sp. KBW10]
MKRIAVLTSGGDAPGMNAAVRAVVRTAIYHNIEVYGIRYGYKGLIEDDIFPMRSRDVANIIQLGGTMLKTARSKEFMTVEGRALAAEQLKKHNIDGLVIIGGDGSFKGACKLYAEHQVPIIGIPGTIDKDISGTDYTIGFDTAVNTAVEAIDKIRDTAAAHDRLFIIEVMGRDAGYIALNSGIATGAESVLVPERITNVERVLNMIDYDQKRKKNVHIIVVAEGDDFGAEALTHVLQNKFPEMEIRHSVLGHMQRGGSPSYYDRVQASRLGYHAVLALKEGKSQLMAGIINNEVKLSPLDEVVKKHQSIDDDLLDMVKILSS